MVVHGASSWEIRFTYASSGLVDDELANENYINVETWTFDEGDSIEACAKNLERFSYEELKDDNK